MKLLLLHSFRSERTIEEATFKFAKGAFGDYYYFVDLQAHRFCEREKIWGILILEENIQQSAESKLALKDETASKFKHLQNNPNIMALEQVMYENYRQSKLTVLGGDEPMTERRHLCTGQHSNAENTNPEPEKKPFRSRIMSHRPSSQFGLY